ncbi:phb depolymerase family esterase [Colletotrichum incanum]|uniref:Carboxylic ester hydrolase n=1 Tax=Colletotrichum incanum TaxID=1573173 RepID=A0A161W0M5_COLIC|nr:phb depolymerase family esterase [Colletotrichum incanum]
MIEGFSEELKTSPLVSISSNTIPYIVTQKLKMHLLNVLLAALPLLSPAEAALQRVTNFGSNPTGLIMDISVPPNLTASPAIILALHPCGGSGQGYASQADYISPSNSKRTFLVIYPSSTKDFNCWDVASTATLKRDGSGDSTGLANMVRYAITRYGADPKRVFVTGSSSGCMMTNVLSATYPDLFAAATCYSGVAAGCLAGSPGSSPISADPKCANGQIVKTGEQWATQVRAMYPGYTGSYPRIQTFHGTADSLVRYPNLAEQLKEWSAIHGVSFTRNNTNTPTGGYTQMVYGDGTKLVGISAQGVGHTVPVQRDQDLKWFGL